MKFKIRWSELRSDPLHIVWLLVYAILAGVAINVIPDALNKLLFTDAKPLWLSSFSRGVPFIEAGGLRIGEALDRFSGKELTSSWGAEQTKILISILVTYVLALPLFVWGMRNRTLWRLETGARRFPTRIVIALGLSGSLVMGSCLLATFPPFISLNVRKSLDNAQRAQSNKDALLNDINYAALRAQSFYYTDVVDGGGGGRWKDIRRAGNPMLGIEEIAPSEPVIGKVVKHFYPQHPSRFLLMVHAQDSLSICGVGNEDGEVDTFANEDGRTGRVQVRAIVTPKRIFVNLEN
jgi:hypothetical protein